MLSLNNKGSSFRVVVDGVVMATSRKYSTELMVQKGIGLKIVKYGLKLRF
jgi:hypothetical protein